MTENLPAHTAEEMVKTLVMALCNIEFSRLKIQHKQNREFHTVTLKYGNARGMGSATTLGDAVSEAVHRLLPPV